MDGGGFQMPEISLTDFVDFLVRAGSPKVTKVRQILERPAYSPATDFWKGMREHLQSHSKGEVALDSVLDDLHSRKDRRYKGATAGYKKFLGKYKPESSFTPPTVKWHEAGLTVRVNPELGLKIAGEKHVIKLYFKDEAPTPHRLDAVLALMRLALGSSGERYRFAVLDVSKGRLILPTRETPDFEALLKAEAASFMAVWAAIGGKKVAGAAAAL